ncbi:calcineurin is a calcium-dependent [Phlyctema vagabunda]|uniref:Calcineurin is a calcium-dependent n=1 Tax=Phlyctema vagabunda TaxID=108571 RepID=A0ABR4P4B4_9HELO
MGSNNHAQGFVIYSDSETRNLPAITFHSTPPHPRPSSTITAAVTTRPRAAVSVESDPARRPLAVTSINAILNNPITPTPGGRGGASKDFTVGYAKPNPEYAAIILPPLKSDSSRSRYSTTTLPSLSTSTSTSTSSSPAACLSHKRKATDDLPLIPHSNHYANATIPTTATNPAQIDNDDDWLHTLDQNCDQIRRKIHSLLQSGDMKVGEFVRTIGVNSKSYGSFMKLSGPHKGSSNGTYHNASVFFKRRELLGIKPTAKKAKVSTEYESRKLPMQDLSSIQLEGEADMEVPVYETCDEVRKKITAYLREPGITQAGFLRDIAKSFPDDSDGRRARRNPPQSKVLKDFLSKKGAKAGNTSAVFYGSYVFFEKMRIRDGKPKSQFRLDMERIYAAGDEDAEDALEDSKEGFGSSAVVNVTGGTSSSSSRRSKRGIDIKRAASAKVWCMKGERVHEDKYGRLSFH